MDMMKAFWTCALITLVFVSICAAEEEKASETAAGFEGSWTAGQFLMNITVNENGEVTATYDPTDPDAADPGVIEGKLSEDGTELTGTWTETGVFTFVLSDEGSIFNGTYVSKDSNGNEFTGIWNGTRKNDDTSVKPTGWNGTWESDLSVLTLQEDGQVITGTYEPYTPGEDGLSEPGVIEGTISEDGNEVTGTWTETGRVLFTLSDDGTSFNGTYGFGDEDHLEGAVDDSWPGTRIL